MTSETLREQQGRDLEDQQADDHDEPHGVDGAQSRSTAFTTYPSTTKTVIVRATKMTSVIPTAQSGQGVLPYLLDGQEISEP